MADRSKIEWTDRTWNPIRARNLKTGKVGWHCEHLSPGCANCYAGLMNAWRGTGLPFKPGHRADIEIFLDEKVLVQPLRWREPGMVFVCSMTDLFAEFVTDEMLDRIFAVMALCPQHTLQVLTKRSARMRAYLSMARAHPVGLEAMGLTLDEMGRNPRSNVGSGVLLQGDIVHLKVWPLPNVWLGVSAEDQGRADGRRDDLATIARQGWTTFVSYEPSLGPVDWRGWEFLAWLISGGESGPNARPSHPDWHRAARDFCLPRGIAFFFKQWGDWAFEGQSIFQPGPAFFNSDGEPVDEKPPFGPAMGARWHWWEPDLTASYRIGKGASGRLLDGRTHDAMPVRGLTAEAA